MSFETASSETQSPCFSVVIAVYNGEATLPATLQCLTGQTFKDFEIVLVNDASQDGSEKIIREFAEKNPQLSIQVVAQENKGLGGARNTGMRRARGRFISLLDQDDRWYPSKLEKTARVFESHADADFVTHHLYRRVESRITEELECRFMVENLFRRLLFDDNHFCGSAMSFRKGVLEQIGYFSEDRTRFHLTEDYDYWLRAAARGLKFFVLEEVLGEYVVHGGNFSKNRRMMLANEWRVVRQHYRERPARRLLDPLHLARRRAKIWARHAISYFQ